MLPLLLFKEIEGKSRTVLPNLIHKILEGLLPKLIE
jgi:hypothetical protein